MVPSVSAEAPSGVVLTIDRSPAVVTAAPVPAAVVVATPDAAVVVATREAVPSTAVVATPRPAPDMPQVMASRRRVWRDASAALVVFASIGLVVVLALPAIGPPAPTPPATAVAAVATDAPTATIEATLPAVALASIPLPTRVEVALPTEAPTPTLPVTQTPRPTERVAAVRAVRSARASRAASRRCSGRQRDPTRVGNGIDASATAGRVPSIVALASIPLPTRVEVALPTEAPTPTLPVR